MNNAQGASNQVLYTNGNRDRDEDNANRLEAGTSISRGTPCYTWPMGQRFWDR